MNEPRITAEHFGFLTRFPSESDKNFADRTRAFNGISRLMGTGKSPRELLLTPLEPYFIGLNLDYNYYLLKTLIVHGDLPVNILHRLSVFAARLTLNSANTQADTSSDRLETDYERLIHAKELWLAGELDDEDLESIRAAFLNSNPENNLRGLSIVWFRFFRDAGYFDINGDRVELVNATLAVINHLKGGRNVSYLHDIQNHLRDLILNEPGRAPP